MFRDLIACVPYVQLSPHLSEIVPAILSFLRKTSILQQGACFDLQVHCLASISNLVKSLLMNERMDICVCVYVCVYVCVCMYVCVYMCVCVLLCALCCVLLCVLLCVCMTSTSTDMLLVLLLVFIC